MNKNNIINKNKNNKNSAKKDEISSMKTFKARGCIRRWRQKQARQRKMIEAKP